MKSVKKNQVNGSELLEVKKSKQANLETRKSTWLLIGYVLVLAVLFVAFEWTATERKETGEVLSGKILLEEEIMIPITLPEKKVVPPPPQAKQITEILEIVEDDAEIEETELVALEEMVMEVIDYGEDLVKYTYESDNITYTVDVERYIVEY
jgi:hypothetical protein